ncbi:expressed unknown protein [Seminavis robusta]|uniref:Uncharacterized protein n=1 Tax=Seminavis robusta TaxID=568900 RepID=A0A9N8EMQ7_9STRA|nr:expressed unknown protein [Seminavis robusta]|eukprot:Sro1231_g254660.1 n/a (620) ;mRNA; r:30147-32006
MLKKWLKKRRKASGSRRGDSDTPQAPATRVDGAPSNSRAGKSRRSSKTGSSDRKKSKARSPARKPQYTNIETEQHTPPYPHEPSTDGRRKSNKNHHAETSDTSNKRNRLLVNPTHNSAVKKEKKEQDVKKEVPLVRIRPIEGPRQRMAGSNSSNTSNTIATDVVETPLITSPSIVEEEEVIETPLKIPVLPDEASEKSPSEKTPGISATSSFVTHNSASSPAPPSSSRKETSTFVSGSTFSIPASLLPPAESLNLNLSRELSYLGVASPPSIDTALFAYEEDERQIKIDRHSSTEPTIAETGHASPPSLIETVMPLKKPPPPADVEESESEASVKSRSELRRELSVDRPFRDDGFLTGARSQSGTGSKKLQMWLDEVKRSIDNQRNQALADFDRYHIGEHKFTEEKSDKGDSSALSSALSATTEEAILTSKLINKALKETIEKSKADMTITPKGILKSKVIEKGTIKDYSFDHNDDEDEESSEVSEEYETSSGEDGPVSDESSYEDQIPVKVFVSRRHRVDDTEDENTSAASRSSSGSEIVYETLRQLKPALSRDDTLKSNSSSQFFYSKICDMMGYEDELGNTDENSISEGTQESRSTVSKESFLVSRGGWLCFGDTF